MHALQSAPQQNKKSVENLLKFLDLNSQVAGVGTTTLPTDFNQNNEKAPIASVPILDMNRMTELPPSGAEKRQNKNDFYRFLLMQNTN